MRSLFFTLCVFFAASHGVTGKFRNLTGRKLRLSWVNFQGKPHMNGYIKAGEEYSFATYATHEFFWGEMTGPEVATTKYNVDPKEARFKIQTGKIVNVITDDTSDPAKLKQYKDNLAFMEEYKGKTGSNWIANMPRVPPIHKYRPAPFIGHTAMVPVDQLAAKWVCGDKTDECREEPAPLVMEVMSTKPRVFKVKNFLSDFECDAIIDHFRDKMSRSFVGDGENARDDSVRTSTSARMSRTALPLSDAVFRRLASVVGLDEKLLHSNGISEMMNIVHYKRTQEYTPHFDTGGDSGQRMARFLSSLLYFNTPKGGGGTGFPAMVNEDGSIGGEVGAEKGSLVFFYDILEDGNYDERSIHSGLPVAEGEKWIAASWLWDPYYAAKPATWVAEHRTANYRSLFDNDGAPLSPLPAYTEGEGWEGLHDQQQKTEL